MEIFCWNRFYKILNAPLFTCFLLQLPIGSSCFFYHVKVLLKVLNQRKEKNEWKNKMMKTKSLSIMVCFSYILTLEKFIFWFDVCLFYFIFFPLSLFVLLYFFNSIILLYTYRFPIKKSANLFIVQKQPFTGIL